jgi:hypothetical protein
LELQKIGFFWVVDPKVQCGVVQKVVHQYKLFNYYEQTYNL